MKFAKIPMATINRLSIYMRTLQDLLDEDVDVISSERLAKQCGVNPAQIRKDLAYFGEFGVRGVGYRVNDLVNQIKEILGLQRPWNLAMIGLGNLGSALIRHANFVKHGYVFTAAFDVDPQKVGKRLPTGLIINHVDELEELIKERDVHVGLITTPASEAQSIANQLVLAGINGILNFAPVQIQVPDCCHVENVDFTIKLDSIAYHLSSGV
ncbi:redox-sensing transcriptional repressor Rex [Desulforhabdus sp. TSK]|jgi:redox-sensing transcriptional repressor|uniref:redox-sensing transcriptional repressor Rex n=1 Tax=Desulforhabdus sp. TSK TaxID=2925014 RepID=UPI001FC89EA5|nr:redox-sensing transcriptional repressor Rex [Desulforhabdus sp. TSK]GKT07086.1 redox-sensing transcriptional repressor Rex [Desulforhabdus sp. TSK]